ncbi:MAG: release factor glutamine methyltransferase [Xanthobacteraceae bacterium]|nr:MAG: release factor glutamine methyltransferase [Xanthobacteraceae bacterium]
MITAGTSFAEARRLAAARLVTAGVDDAALEARLLLKIASGIDVALPTAAASGCLDAEQAGRFDHLLERRIAREPLARITGHGEFHGLDLALNPACLIPRDDTEAIVEAALALLPPGVPARVLDLGVGPGTILLAILSERPAATGVGIDLSEEALAAARANAGALGLADRAAFRRGRWTEGLDGTFDLVVSNPPYIPSADCDGLEPEVALHDPRLALDGGADGLDAYRAILGDAARLLAPGGHVVFEIGMGQAPDVVRLAATHGFRLAGLRSDLSAIPRALAFRLA